MKKYFIALLFGISLMSIQTVSAATLGLSTFFGGSVTTAGPGASVTGTSTSPVSIWSLNVADTVSPVNVNFTLAGAPPVVSFLSGSTHYEFSSTPTNSTFNLLLAAGSYFFGLVPSNGGAYGFTASLDADPIPPSNVPVPAAVWLFGSALLGLVGAGRRKSQPALAA